MGGARSLRRKVTTPTRKKKRAPKARPSKRQRAKEAGYRSGFEMDVASSLNERSIPFSYEEDKIPYTIYYKYTPDFKLGEGLDAIYIEAKGNFKPSDRRKMINVKRCNPELDIRILFMRDNTLNKKSKTTYSRWAEKNGFPWAVGTKIPQRWVAELRVRMSVK